jgi:hypothetical protein
MAFGILFGVALVLLPAVFSMGTSASAPNGFFTTQTFGPARLNPQPGMAGSGSTPLSFLIILLFIFLPSTVVSLVIRRWAEKRAGEYL